MKKSIFKLKSHRDFKFEPYEECPNPRYIHLRNNIFLYREWWGVDIDEEENTFDEQRDEILELPSDETEKLWNNIIKLKKLKER